MFSLVHLPEHALKHGCPQDFDTVQTVPHEIFSWEHNTPGIVFNPQLHSFLTVAKHLGHDTDES
jgi:hypothetical protein